MSEFTLRGFAGENPLGFLAALGLLRVLDHDHPDWTPRLNWTLRGSWRAVLQLSATVGEEQLLRALHHSLASRYRIYEELAASFDQNLKMSRSELRQKLVELLEPPERTLARPMLDLLQACAAELPEVDDEAATSPLRMVNGSGHQNFLPILKEIAHATTEKHLAATVFQPWRFDDSGRNLVAISPGRVACSKSSRGFRAAARWKLQGKLIPRGLFLHSCECSFVEASRTRRGSGYRTIGFCTHVSAASLKHGEPVHPPGDADDFCTLAECSFIEGRHPSRTASGLCSVSAFLRVQLR